MSDRWRRSRAWDERHLRGPLMPVRWVLHALSSIALAMILLGIVVLYGVSASVPIGLLALLPTWLILAGSALLAAAVPGVGGAWVAVRAASRLGRGARFALAFIAGLALAAAGAWAWHRFAWPRLHYDPVTGGGVRLFASFVERYEAVTLRRLPGLEMSELEYYAWWPLRAVLLLFVVNMMVATLRRIDFTFRNLGVLTVHTGIVTLALGSVYYGGLKLEGDAILIAGAADPETGTPGVGPPQGTFHDGTRLSLFASQGQGWEQRPLRGVPRYNDYGLGAFAGTAASEISRAARPWSSGDDGRALDLPVRGTTLGRVDPDVSLRVVGYSAYAAPVTDWLRIEPGDAEAVVAGQRETPLRFVYLHSARPDGDGRTSDAPVYAFTLPPALPAHRIATSRDADGTAVLSIEYTLGAGAGMPEERWRDLAEPLPAGTMHALVVEVPGGAGDGAAPFRGVFPVNAGTGIVAGRTGFRLTVERIEPEPPFPIITEGYKGASSAVAIVRVTPPGGAPPFTRWIYHRFPEIGQDMLDETGPTGMPARRDADPSIRIALIEADHLIVQIDEPSPGTTRAIVRQPGGAVRVVDRLEADGRLREVVPDIALRVGDRWEDAVEVDRPRPVAPAERDPKFLGTHDKAMLGVEVTVPRTASATGSARESWRRVVWLPFTRYVGVGMGTERTVRLPDGRPLTLAFGRLQHRLPGFELELVDFQMLAYDHRGAPRDYQSVVRVRPAGDDFAPAADFEPFEHVTKLNEPLRAPFEWREDRAWPVNVARALAAGLNPRQFKFSQAGWDQEGWTRTQKLVDEGSLRRPAAAFTILGVGNNPGIHLIALGGVLMGIGMPWAFYVKPWLVRREKRRIQEALAAGTYRRPVRNPAPERVGVGV